MVEVGLEHDGRTNWAHMVVVINHYPKRYLIVQLQAKLIPLLIWGLWTYKKLRFDRNKLAVYQLNQFPSKWIPKAKQTLFRKLFIETINSWLTSQWPISDSSLLEKSNLKIDVCQPPLNFWYEWSFFFKNEIGRPTSVTQKLF